MDSEHNNSSKKQSNTTCEEKNEDCCKENTLQQDLNNDLQKIINITSTRLSWDKYFIIAVLAAKRSSCLNACRLCPC